MLENGFALIGVAALAGAIAFLTNWLALIPWRRARLLHPVVGAAGANAWSIPAILAIGISLGWPEDSPPWVLVTFFAALGIMVANTVLGHEIRPRIKLRDLLRETLRTWLLSFASWFLFLGAVALMPNEFNRRAFIVFEIFLLSALLWDRFMHNG